MGLMDVATYCCTVASILCYFRKEFCAFKDTPSCKLQLNYLLLYIILVAIQSLNKLSDVKLTSYSASNVPGQGYVTPASQGRSDLQTLHT